MAFLERLLFWCTADRLGPDMPMTHWCLHFKFTMRKLCARKFKFLGAGAEFRPGSYAVSCAKISLGNRVVVRPGSMLFADPRDGGAGITLEDDVLLGSAVQIYVNNHAFDDVTVPIIDQGHQPSVPVLIEKGAWIGAGVIILPGVTIGRNAVVGAGAVVTKSVPSFAVAVGNPARVVKHLNNHGPGYD